jgi:hypothetical protein
MSKEFKTTGRGFKIFGELTDEYGSDLTLVESSAVGAPNVRLYAYEKEKRTIEVPFSSCITFDVDGAKKLIEALQDFVDDAESPENWRNDPEYKKVWG